MKKKINTSKEFIRGSIKEIMRTHSLRSISFANFDKWAGNTTPEFVHTINLNNENGFIRFYGYQENQASSRKGAIINDVPVEIYQNTYERLLNIINRYDEIPQKVRRNILVGLYR